MKDEITYRGFTITVTSAQTRFGTLYRSINDIGEPYMEDLAHPTRQKAIEAAQRDIDQYIEELN